jgi:hypothetical protein
MATQTGRRLAPFALTKWYFDCVADDGRVVIGYWASLAWRKLAFTWESVVLYEPGKPPGRRSAISTSPAPEVNADAIAWHSSALRCSLEAERRQASVGQCLLDDGLGVVDWRAEAPAALVTVQVHGHAPLRGPGYAERLVLTVPPWRLPIRELRWGRWLDADARHSVVWIDWRGTSPRSWVFIDGQAAVPAQVTDGVVASDDATVSIGARRTLESMSFAQVAAAIPPLRAVLPKSMLALSETKWCSDATRQCAAGPPLAGRAIHEVVVFA